MSLLPTVIDLQILMLLTKIAFICNHLGMIGVKLPLFISLSEIECASGEVISITYQLGMAESPVYNEAIIVGNNRLLCF